jgi:hypothetical protein
MTKIGKIVILKLSEKAKKRGFQKKRPNRAIFKFKSKGIIYG